LQGIRLVVSLAEVCGLKLWGADVGNAYLEAKTKEKLHIVAGPEFGSLDGHTLVIDKAFMVYDRQVYVGINVLLMFFVQWG
jgi:hypothetical protein